MRQSLSLKDTVLHTSQTVEQKARNFCSRGFGEDVFRDVVKYSFCELATHKLQDSAVRTIGAKRWATL